MQAVALIRRRVVLAANAFAEIAVWRVPKPVPPSEHPFKYSLAYVVNGECVLRYDNERGKGDHRHWLKAESAYAFSTPEQLMADFEADIERWNHENSHSGSA
ncbi:MAG: hypothetical protein HXX19_00095 [Rhodoferax sp.]|nr:hypothetical protein [Rhodoferax sp.]